MKVLKVASAAFLAGLVGVLCGDFRLIDLTIIGILVLIYLEQRIPSKK